MALSSTSKYNYIDVVNRMVPEFYREVDYFANGSQEDISLVFLGKLLKAAHENDFYFSVSGQTKLQVASFFIPSKRKTYISPTNFLSVVLAPYSKTFDDFTSTEELKKFVKETFLPAAELNNPIGLFSALSGAGFGAYSSLELVHNHLIDSLGMFYFMNTSSLSSTQASATASSILVDAIVDPIMKGETLREKHSINTLFKYFWSNRDESTYYNTFTPTQYRFTPSDLSSSTHFSGTQMLDVIQAQLETWTDPKLKNHTFLEDSLTLLFNSGPYPSRLRDAGAFQDFLKAVSLGIADLNLIVEEISDLLSIDECPDRFLELLANNIGWIFLTGDYDKWRAQLRNAVMIYKSKGSVLGLDAALKMIFSDGVFSLSDVAESWESYIPKLLYYLIKSESFIAKENLITSGSPDTWFGTLPPDVKFQALPGSYIEAADRNYRFLVDSVLEDMNNKFGNIKINGRDFREDPLWTCIPEPRGFLHRNYPQDVHYNTSPSGGITVAVPPWEKYGFYKETSFNSRVVDYFVNVLSGTRENFGFEINPAYVAAFEKMLRSTETQIYALSGTPLFAQNNKFRVFTEDRVVPPNHAKIVEWGSDLPTSDFDLWNTRSSTVFATIAASALDYTVDRYDTFKNKVALEVFRDVLREFIPFHVTSRVLLYEDFKDDHEICETNCLLFRSCVDDMNVEYLRSYRKDFWAGASGTGDLSTTYVNGDGRRLPTYLEGTSDPSSMFWHVSATDLDRNTSRRRDYRYILKCYPFKREGKAMPIATTHFPFATSSSIPNLSSDPYLNTWEFILKGFDYSLQNYLPMSSTVWAGSGSFSGDGECYAGGTDVQGHDVSNLYPVRAVPESGSCSSVPMYRNDLGTSRTPLGLVDAGVVGLMTRLKIREAPTTSSIYFGDVDYRSFEFGTPAHRMYNLYKTDFSGVLKNYEISSMQYDGGYNFISYAYGPSLFNSNFVYPGLIVNNTSSTLPPYPGTDIYPRGYLPEWSSVVGGSEAGESSYYTASGTVATLNAATYFNSAPTAPDVTSLSGIIYGEDHLGSSFKKTNEIFSGIELRQPDGGGGGIIIANNGKAGNLWNADYLKSVTFYKPGYKGLDVVFPFDPALNGDPRYNTLRSNTSFKCSIAAKTVTNKARQFIVLGLFTSGLMGVDSKEITWGFDWDSNSWKVHTNHTDGNFYKRVSVDKDLQCPSIYDVEFNTLESRTEKLEGCGTSIINSNVHTSSTGYILRMRAEGVTRTVSREEGLVIMDGLTIYEVSILDKSLNLQVNRFNTVELDTLFTFWDTMSVGSHSRDATYSEPYFETAGGSKAEYLELLGGDTVTSTGSIMVDRFTNIDYTNYEVED